MKTLKFIKAKKNSNLIRTYENTRNFKHLHLKEH